jgi:hypothetical protein
MRPLHNPLKKPQKLKNPGLSLTNLKNAKKPIFIQKNIYISIFFWLIFWLFVKKDTIIPKLLSNSCKHLPLWLDCKQ